MIIVSLKMSNIVDIDIDIICLFWRAFRVFWVVWLGFGWFLGGLAGFWVVWHIFGFTANASSR